MKTLDKKYNNRWQLKMRIEEKYKTWLHALLLPIKKKVIVAAKSGDVKKVERLLKKASKSKVFRKKSEEIAKKIVTMTLEDDAKDWREAAAKSSKGKLIYDLLKSEFERDSNAKKRYDELIERNAKLITTLPDEIADDVVKHISRKSFGGERSSDIAKEIIAFFPKHTKAKENLIARTESAKCKSALTQVRSENIGIYWAEWVSTDDQRTRPSHAIMNGVICNYKHPPSPEELAKKAGVYNGKIYGRYFGGEIFNCRCFMEPIVDIDYIDFPAKVYNWKANRIETMSKNQFLEFAKKHNYPVKEF